MRVEPGKPRITIQPQGTGIAVSCPSRSNLFVAVFIVVWLAGWTFGGITAFGEAMNPRNGDRLFMVIWLLGWTAGELYAVGTVLWLVAGREDLIVDGNGLTHRISAAGLGRTREYAAADIRGLRAVPQLASPWWMNQSAYTPPIFGSGFGAIAFDYGARTYRVGAGLDEAEARLVLAEVSRRFPRMVDVS